MKRALGAVPLALSLLVSCTNDEGRFLLVNKAKEPIARATVAICGQTIELKDIASTQSASGAYEVKADSHYDIHIEFQSGKKLQTETGYVTHGMDFQHEIVVTDSDVDITDTNVK